jgi:low affinity Fe/Cu permease
MLRKHFPNGRRPQNKLSASSRKQKRGFHGFARTCARITGHPLAFGIAVAVILIWALTGPLFGFSDTWQLVVNTATTIITFLIVFLIQNTQNRDSEAVQLKLDELIRATKTSHNALLEIEELSDAELNKIKANYTALAEVAREAVRSGKSDLGSPEIEKKN